MLNFNSSHIPRIYCSCTCDSGGGLV